MSNPRTLHQIEFLDDGNAVFRFTDGHEAIVPSDDAAEELRRIQLREGDAILAAIQEAFENMEPGMSGPFDECIPIPTIEWP